MQTFFLILAIIAVVAIVAFVGLYCLMVSSYALGLAEDYYECKDEPQFLEDYDKFLKSWNPIHRWACKRWELYELRNMSDEDLEREYGY